MTHSVRRLRPSTPLVGGTRDYAAGLDLALRNCGESFEAAQTLYNRLSPDERRERFPNGGLKP